MKKIISIIMALFVMISYASAIFTVAAEENKDVIVKVIMNGTAQCVGDHGSYLTFDDSDFNNGVYKKQITITNTSEITLKCRPYLVNDWTDIGTASDWANLAPEESKTFTVELKQTDAKADEEYLTKIWYRIGVVDTSWQTVPEGTEFYIQADAEVFEWLSDGGNTVTEADALPPLVKDAVALKITMLAQTKNWNSNYAGDLSKNIAFTANDFENGQMKKEMIVSNASDHDLYLQVQIENSAWQRLGGSDGLICIPAHTAETVDVMLEESKVKEGDTYLSDCWYRIFVQSDKNISTEVEHMVAPGTVFYLQGDSSFFSMIHETDVYRAEAIWDDTEIKNSIQPPAPAKKPVALKAEMKGITEGNDISNYIGASKNKIAFSAEDFVQGIVTRTFTVINASEQDIYLMATVQNSQWQSISEPGELVKIPAYGSEKISVLLKEESTMEDGIYLTNLWYRFFVQSAPMISADTVVPAGTVIYIQGDEALYAMAEDNNRYTTTLLYDIAEIEAVLNKNVSEEITVNAVKYTLSEAYENQNQTLYITNGSATGSITQADVKNGTLTKTLQIRNSGKEALSVRFSMQLLHDKQWKAPEEAEYVLLQPGEAKNITYSCQLKDGKIAVENSLYEISALFPRFDIQNAEGGNSLPEGTSITVSGFPVDFLMTVSSSNAKILTEAVSEPKITGDMLNWFVFCSGIMAAAVFAVIAKKRKEYFMK